MRKLVQNCCLWKLFWTVVESVLVVVVAVAVGVSVVVAVKVVVVAVILVVVVVVVVDEVVLVFTVFISPETSWY